VTVADIPAVEAELARLRAENARLLKLLKLTPQQAAPPGPARAAYFKAPPGMVDDGSAPPQKVAFYAALFAARTDVYATRGLAAGGARRRRSPPGGPPITPTVPVQSSRAFSEARVAAGIQAPIQMLEPGVG
jgi:hypothetical protein